MAIPNPIARNSVFDTWYKMVLEFELTRLRLKIKMILGIVKKALKMSP
jgi:hypothetical protein